MKQIVIAERICLIGHIVSMFFGLVGILLVVPNAEVLFHLSEFGQTAMQWSMAGGGVVYMILGAAAIFICPTHIRVRSYFGFYATCCTNILNQ